jgi:cytochrome c
MIAPLTPKVSGFIHTQQRAKILCQALHCCHSHDTKGNRKNSNNNKAIENEYIQYSRLASMEICLREKTLYCQF